jgi:Mrp family chromosome partitioning ATPase
MRRLVATFDRVIIDSPPLVPVSDAQILAASADATVLVMRMNQSSRQLVSRCRDLLKQVNARVLGAVVNDVPASVFGRYYGGAWRYGAPGEARRLPIPAARPQDSGRDPDLTVGEVIEPLLDLEPQLAPEPR